MRVRTFTGSFSCDASDGTSLMVVHFDTDGWSGVIGSCSGGFSWGEQIEAPVRLDYDPDTGTITVTDTE